MSENSSQDERISSMALQRKAYDDFLKWKSAPDRRALLVTGARQVGKTYLIREFGRNEYEVFLEINFIETPKAREIFEGDLDVYKRQVFSSLSGRSASPPKRSGLLVLSRTIK